jgi:hypothetical protein
MLGCPPLTRRYLIVPVVLLAIGRAMAQPANPGPITAEGSRLAALLDGMDVETLWQQGYHIEWQTGAAKGPPETTPGRHTHCSSFAAAVGARLGIYLLRPPEHRQTVLANAQERWLNSPAAEGWQRLGRLGDPGASLHAVALANQGKFVVAVYFQPPKADKEVPGHIAIVRPSDKAPALIESDGPDVIQAGMHNHRLTTLRAGFADHPAAWSTGAIEFFSHDANPA